MPFDTKCLGSLKVVSTRKGAKVPQLLCLPPLPFRNGGAERVGFPRGLLPVEGCVAQDGGIPRQRRRPASGAIDRSPGVGRCASSIRPLVETRGDWGNKEGTREVCV